MQNRATHTFPIVQRYAFASYVQNMSGFILIFASCTTKNHHAFNPNSRTLANMKTHLFIGLSLLYCLFWQKCNTPHESNGQNAKTAPIGQHAGNEQHAHTNKLINESSPYLLQHAHNPVNWYPWGEEALQKARDENKVLIISVGYAACHWCHVMEHESFEDSTVAAIMNEHFVAVKIDREERPDIDNVYMTACHLIKQWEGGGSCGWPLNAFALPDGRPFYAATYFPKEAWLNALNSFAKIHQTEPEKLEEQAAQITQGVQNAEMISFNPSKPAFELADLNKLFNAWKPNMDFEKGGPNRAPKFPMPSNYLYLLQYHHQTGNKDVLKAINVTLDNMALGGIYDQVGGGFARYSTDKKWLAPHFEKMLYDNGQLVSLYAKTYQLTKKPLYKQAVYHTLEFIEREMTSPEGGFYSSLDADSEGEEGKFYVWTKQEFDKALGANAPIMSEYYNVSEKGNWEHHKNILHRTYPEVDMAKKRDMSDAEWKRFVSKANAKLLAERAKRVRPGLDDKILTSWNALMLTGYVDAYRAFGEQRFLDAALKNAHFILKNCKQKDHRLNRNYKDGKSVINAFLDDYSLTAEAFIALYQATFDEKWLYEAKNLVDYAIAHFYDTQSGMFFYTSDLDPALITRKMEVSDNVIPASNSSMAKALYALGLYFGNKDYTKKAVQMLNNVKIMVLQNGRFYSNWGILLSHFVREPYELAIVGDDWEALRSELDNHYLPNMLLSGGEDEGTLELLKNKLSKGQTRIYVCQNKVCKFPVTEVSKALELMR